MARYIAKNIVAAELASRCEVQLAYAIGVAEPVSVRVETFGTGEMPDVEIAEKVKLSRPSISRLLLEARELSIIDIRINLQAVFLSRRLHDLPGACGACRGYHVLQPAFSHGKVFEILRDPIFCQDWLYNGKIFMGPFHQQKRI